MKSPAKCRYRTRTGQSGQDRSRHGFTLNLKEKKTAYVFRFVWINYKRVITYKTFTTHRPSDRSCAVSLRVTPGLRSLQAGVHPLRRLAGTGCGAPAGRQEPCRERSA